MVIDPLHEIAAGEALGAQRPEASAIVRAAWGLVAAMADPILLAGLAALAAQARRGEWLIVSSDIVWYAVPLVLAAGVMVGYRLAWMVALGYHVLSGMFVFWMACCFTMGAPIVRRTAARTTSEQLAIALTIVAVGALVQLSRGGHSRRRIRDDLGRLLIRERPERR